jgi:hypothetical protein
MNLSKLFSIDFLVAERGRSAFFLLFDGETKEKRLQQSIQDKLSKIAFFQEYAFKRISVC